MSTKKLKLANGLSVLLIEDHKAPVVSVQMWVNTGSADERKGEEGISHFIEHLVFKGTQKYGVGEIASIVEASGGELNAYTSFDQTVFYVTISRQFADIGLDVITEMMGFPRFDAAEIDNEREVVLEEIKRSNDSPGRQASRLLFSSVYKKHPYGIPVIGYDRIIKKVSRKTLTDYYTSRYVPENMLLVVAGDFDNAAMTKQIRERFGTLKKFRLRKVVRKKESKQTSSRIAVRKGAVEEAHFHMSWRVPGAHHKDIAALDVLALIFGQGDSSRLVTRLRMEQALVNSVGASTFTPKDGGLISISGTMNVDNLDATFTVINEELRKLLSEPPSAEEIKKAVTNLESEEFYSMETVDGLARKAGSLETLMGDHAYFQKFLKQVQALKPADLLRVARTYLQPSTMTLVMMVPRNEKATSGFLRRWHKTFAKTYAAAKATRQPAKRAVRLPKMKWAIDKPAASRGTKLEKVRLSSGTTVLFRPSFDTPIFSAKAAFLGGLRVEEGGKDGLTELLSRVWTSGTKRMNEAEIQIAIENMAGGLSAFGGRNSAGLSMQTLAPFEAQAAELFDEILAEPVMSEAAVEREKTLMLEVLKAREDNPGQVVSKMFVETLFQGHPYARDTAGTPDSIPSLQTKDVVGHWHKMANAGNLTVVLTGAVARDKWLERIERASKHFERGGPLKTHFAHEGPKKDLRHFKQMDREQSHIIVGYKGLTLTDERRYVLQLIQSVLAGQGGRLFIELRDKASLAYTVAPMRMEGIDTGYFGAYIGCSPEKGVKAIEMLHAEFNKLVKTLLSTSELERAKRYLIGRHDIDLQRASSIGSAILFNEIYGIDSEETFRFAERLAKITPDHVQSLAREIFTRPEVTCAVGKVQPW